MVLARAAFALAAVKSRRPAPSAGLRYKTWEYFQDLQLWIDSGHRTASTVGIRIHVALSGFIESTEGLSCSIIQSAAHRARLDIEFDAGVRTSGGISAENCA